MARYFHDPYTKRVVGLDNDVDISGLEAYERLLSYETTWLGVGVLLALFERFDQASNQTTGE